MGELFHSESPSRVEGWRGLGVVFLVSPSTEAVAVDCSALTSPDPGDCAGYGSVVWYNAWIINNALVVDKAFKKFFVCH